MKKNRVIITLLMLASAALVFVGKSIIYGPGFSISYSYIGALFPDADTSFRWTTTVYCWLLLVCGVLASIFAWLKPKWAAVLTLILCLCPVIWHVIASIINHYGVFDLSGIWDWLMLLLPLIAALFSIALIRGNGEQG